MDDQMECMCLQCGVSAYFDFDRVSVQDAENLKVVANCFCPECGGPLIVVGRAGAEPNYKLT